MPVTKTGRRSAGLAAVGLAASLLATLPATAQTSPAPAAPAPAAPAPAAPAPAGAAAPILPFPQVSNAPIERVFEMLDADHDGVVTLAEALKGVDELFDAVDQNKDGSLDKAEFDSWFGRANLDMARFFLTLHDIDGDGKVTRSEFQAPMKKRFALFDRNDDGKVTPEELLYAKVLIGGGMPTGPLPPVADLPAEPRRMPTAPTGAMPQGLPNPMPQGLGQAMPPAMPPAVGRAMGQPMPQGLGGPMPQGMGQAMPQGMGQPIPQGMGQPMPQGDLGRMQSYPGAGSGNWAPGQGWMRQGGDAPITPNWQTNPLYPPQGMRR